MVYLNFNNLDLKTQQNLIRKSKMEVSTKYGKELKKYSVENHLEYESLLEEETIKNLYNYTFIFKI